MERDVRAAVAGAELLDLVDAAVAVGVAQREDLAKSGLGVDVAVWRDGDAAQTLGGVADLPVDDEVVGDDQRAETGGSTIAPSSGSGAGRVVCAAPETRLSARMESRSFFMAVGLVMD